MRHGEVEGNSTAAGGRLTFAGWVDKPLTARGETQAQATAKRFSSEKIDVVLSSDLIRARRTAELIAAPHALEVRVESAFRELNYGAWEGLGLEEIERDYLDIWQARQRDAESVAPPDGENYADLWRRLEPAWESLVNGFAADANVVLVAHNGTLRTLICHLLGAPVNNLKRIQTSNCGVSLVEIARNADIEYSISDEIVLRTINDTHHLNGI